MIRLIPFIALCLTAVGCEQHHHHWHQNPPFSESRSGFDEEKLLALHNQQRGRAYLEIHPDLTAAAKEHAAWMAQNQRLSHYGKGSLQDRIRRNSSLRWMAMGENIAYGYETEESVVSGWMNSSGHRRNILNPQFAYVGMAAVQAQNGQTYWCVVFGTH